PWACPLNRGISKPYGLRAEDEMNETPQQYTQRILGYVEGKEPLEVQASTRGKLEGLIKGLSMTNVSQLGVCSQRIGPDDVSECHIVIRRRVARCALLPSSACDEDRSARYPSHRLDATATPLRSHGLSKPTRLGRNRVTGQCTVAGPQRGTVRNPAPLEDAVARCNRT